MQVAAVEEVLVPAKGLGGGDGQVLDEGFVLWVETVDEWCWVPEGWTAAVDVGRW